MRQLVILSGKGGTGKTTVAAALAHLASSEGLIVIADADVDAANLELVLNPTTVEEHAFVAGNVAHIDGSLCTACGECARLCRFDAVMAADESYAIDRLACEGCGVCFHFCPASAICLQPRHAGQWYRSQTRYGPLFHARLFAGEGNSGKLVTLVKQQACSMAVDTGARFLLVDGPPGIGCPVIAACVGADLALLVAEPTVSGVHDLERILATCDHFGLRSAVLVNKADLNARRLAQIEDLCASRGTRVLGHVPFDLVVTEAMVHGQPVTAYADGPVSDELRLAWARIKEQLGA